MRRPNKATFYYDKRRKDFIMKWDCNKTRGAAHFFHNQLNAPIMRLNVHYNRSDGGMPIRFDPSFLDQLKEGGFDITTIRCTIELKRKSE